MIPKELIGLSLLLHCEGMSIQSSYLFEQVRKHSYYKFKQWDELEVFLMKEETGVYFCWRVDEPILKYKTSVFT